MLCEKLKIKHVIIIAPARNVNLNINSCEQCKGCLYVLFMYGEIDNNRC